MGTVRCGSRGPMGPGGAEEGFGGGGGVGGHEGVMLGGAAVGGRAGRGHAGAPGGDGLRMGGGVAAVEPDEEQGGAAEVPGEMDGGLGAGGLVVEQAALRNLLPGLREQLAAVDVEEPVAGPGRETPGGRCEVFFAGGQADDPLHGVLVGVGQVVMIGKAVVRADAGGFVDGDDEGAFFVRAACGQPEIQAGAFGEDEGAAACLGGGEMVPGLGRGVHARRVGTGKGWGWLGVRVFATVFWDRIDRI